MHLRESRTSKFSGGACPRTPLGLKPLWAFGKYTRLLLLSTHLCKNLLKPLVRYYNNNTEKSSQQATQLTKWRKSQQRCQQLNNGIIALYGKLFSIISGKRSGKKKAYLHHQEIDFKSASLPSKKQNCRNKTAIPRKTNFFVIVHYFCLHKCKLFAFLCKGRSI